MFNCRRNSLWSESPPIAQWRVSSIITSMCVLTC
jgi:hypothetical protein